MSASPNDVALGRDACLRHIEKASCASLHASESECIILAKPMLHGGKAAASFGKADFVAKPQIALKECSETEYWVEAIQKGFDSIGFSEHTYLQYSSFPNQLTTDKMELYKKEIKQLKHKYQDKIDIFCGLEYDFYSEINTDYFDYVIGSVHYLDCNGNIVTFDRSLKETFDYVNVNFGGDGLKFAKKYFETVARLPEKNGFDIIGHFDLITKNNEIGKFIDTSSKKYLNYGFEAIHTLNGKIPFFEVNTGAISRGYRTSPFPKNVNKWVEKRRGFPLLFSVNFSVLLFGEKGGAVFLKG